MHDICLIAKIDSMYYLFLVFLGLLFGGCSSSPNNKPVSINYVKIEDYLLNKSFIHFQKQISDFNLSSYKVPLDNQDSVKYEFTKEVSTKPESDISFNYSFHQQYKLNCQNDLELFYYIKNGQKGSRNLIYDDDYIKYQEYVKNVEHSLENTEDKWSNKIAQKQVALMNLVGFPDPDPTSVKSEYLSSKFGVDFFVAKKLREDIRKIVLERDRYYSRVLDEFSNSKSEFNDNYKVTDSDLKEIQLISKEYMKHTEQLEHSFALEQFKQPDLSDIKNFNIVNFIKLSQPTISYKELMQVPKMDRDLIRKYIQTIVKIWATQKNVSVWEYGKNQEKDTNEFLSWLENEYFNLDEI